MSRPATVTINTGSAAVEIGRVDPRTRPTKQIGPLIELPAQTSLTLTVNQVQGLVIREKP